VLIYLLLNLKYLRDYNVLPLITVVIVNLLAETLALYLEVNHLKNGTYWIFNFSLPVELISYGMIYQRVFRYSKFNYVIRGSYIAIPLLFLYSLVLNKSILPFYTPVAVFGAAFLLLVTLAFFIKLFIADFFFTNPGRQFYFWLSTGLLICYLGGFMHLINLNYFKSIPQVLEMLRSINLVVNCFLYMCIVISVKCLKTYPESQLRYF
jgi:hypothetical protein